MKAYKGVDISVETDEPAFVLDKGFYFTADKQQLSLPEEKTVKFNETFTIITWIKANSASGIRTIFEKKKYESNFEPRI
jgi:hypothetical protein